jgi:hypothetical protein
MSFYFVVYFKSVGARPYIRKNGIKVNSILENAKSPVLATTVSKSERQEQSASAIPIKVFWEASNCFFVKNRKIYFQNKNNNCNSYFVSHLSLILHFLKII